MQAGITLGILAGGQGSRLGGIDKAFVVHHGQSLLARSLAAAGDGYEATLVSYNQDPSRLQGLGVRAVADLRPGSLGPLAGLEALLQATASRWLLTLPVDLADIPGGLCAILAAKAQAAGIRPVVLADGDGLQPLVAVWPVAETRHAVDAALASGEGAVRSLLDAMHPQVHDISPLRIGNLNTPEDFR